MTRLSLISLCIVCAVWGASVCRVSTYENDVKSDYGSSPVFNLTVANVYEISLSNPSQKPSLVFNQSLGCNEVHGVYAGLISFDWVVTVIDDCNLDNPLPTQTVAIYSTVGAKKMITFVAGAGYSFSNFVVTDAGDSFPSIGVFYNSSDEIWYGTDGMPESTPPSTAVEPFAPLSDQTYVRIFLVGYGDGLVALVAAQNGSFYALSFTASPHNVLQYTVQVKGLPSSNQIVDVALADYTAGTLSVLVESKGAFSLYAVPSVFLSGSHKTVTATSTSVSSKFLAGFFTNAAAYNSTLGEWNVVASQTNFRGMTNVAIMSISSGGSVSSTSSPVKLASPGARVGDINCSPGSWP